MSAQEEIRLEDLSEGQQEVAALIGPENFRKLMEVYGGGYAYLPTTGTVGRVGGMRGLSAGVGGV